MKRTMRVLFLVAIYCGGVAVTTSGSLAYWQDRWPALAERDCREDLAVSLLLGLIPVSWVVVPFLTGFYEYGFAWRCPASSNVGQAR